MTRARLRRIRNHVRGPEREFYAMVSPGFEPAARAELAALPGVRVGSTDKGGLTFFGRLEACYRAHLCCHTINRIVMRLAAFRAFYFNRLRSFCREFPWELYLETGQSLAIQVSVHSSPLFHRDRIVQETWSGLNRRLLDQGLQVKLLSGGAHSDPQQRVFVRISGDRVCLSLDASGELLYRRGFAKHTGRAPLRDTLAAAVLKTAGWPDFDYLLDPMCGAGTFSLAAAQMAAGLAPGFWRCFAFEQWPAFSPTAWAHLRKTVAAAARPAAGIRIYAADKLERELGLAMDNALKCGVSELIHFSRADFFSIPPPGGLFGRGLLVLNPPYGKRLPAEDLQAFYRRLGQRIRHHYRGLALAVIAPGEMAEAALGLEVKEKIPFRNGGIKAALLIGK